jgi:hypothetical protein
MKFRRTAAELERTAEQELEDQIRAGVRGRELPDIPREFWNALRVRTNERIDHAASGKAITLSWAARVAIPGIVALLSFLVGLHYYAPIPGTRGRPLASVLEELPASTVDSLVWTSAVDSDSAGAEFVNATVFDAASEEIAAYLLEAGATAQVSEFLDDDDVDQILRSMTKPAKQEDS